VSPIAPPQPPVPSAPPARRPGATAGGGSGPGGPRARTSLGSRGRLAVCLIVVLGAVGFLLYQGLGNATVYFRTADQAVADKASLGARRFRIEGMVMPGTIRTAGASVLFQIGQNGVRVDVVHTGDQPQLFKDSSPVVLEGRWDGDHFASDRIMIKHSGDYKTQHPDRVQGAPA